MLKMTIDNEEVLSNNDISIKEEILSPSSTILNNVYPKSWEQDKDYVSRFYYPKDYSKLNIQNFSIEPEEAGTTIQINGNATLNDVDTTKESRVLRVLGQTSQVQYTGKNLVGTTNVSSTTTNGITYSITGDTITINGTATANTTIMTTTNFALSQNTTYTLSFTTVSGSKDNTYMGLRFRRNGSQVAFIQTNTPSSKSMDLTNISDVQFYILSGTVFTNYSFRFQLEAKSSATSFEPYVGGTASPNPSYPQPVNVVSGDNEIKICGKNLEQEIEIGGISNTGQNYVNNATIRSKYYNAVAPNTTYALSFNGALSGFNVAQYDKDKTFISFTFRSGTITTSENTRYIRINKTGTLNDKVQIEKGSTATTYEPYIGNTYPLYLGVENLIEDNKIYLNYGLGDNGTIFSNAPTRTTIYKVPVLPNLTYTVSCANGYQIGNIFNYNSSETWTDTTTFSYSTSHTFTNSSTTYFVSFVMKRDDNGNMTSSDLPLLKVQLEKGSKANSYSAYGTTPIELCKIGTYQDYIYKDNGSWYLHKEIGKQIFDGNSQMLWGVNSQWDTSNPTVLHIFSNSLNDIWKKGQSGFLSNNFICTTEAQRDFDKEMITCHTTTTTPYFFIKFDRLTGVSSTSTVAQKITALNSWLSNNNTSLYYVLATPTNTLIEDTTLIEQLEALSS